MEPQTRQAVQLIVIGAIVAAGLFWMAWPDEPRAFASYPDPSTYGMDAQLEKILGPVGTRISEALLVGMMERLQMTDGIGEGTRVDIRVGDFVRQFVRVAGEDTVWLRVQ